MYYNLTSDQKELLRDLVKLKKEGVLGDGFLVSSMQDPKRANAWINSIQLNNGEQFSFNNISDLDALCEDEHRLLSCKWNNKGTAKLYSIRQAAFDAVDNDFKEPLSFEDKALIFLQRLYDEVGHDTNKFVSAFDLQGDDFTREEALQIGYEFIVENKGWAAYIPHDTGSPDITITPEGINRIESKPSVSNIQTSVKPAQAEIVYVDLDRIDELRAIASEDFDLTRLIRLCEELNSNWVNGNYLSVAMLTRTIIHHAPPIFGFSNFEQVASQYPGKSFKENMQRLRSSLKPIADRHLHSPIRKSESLPNGTQVDFRGDLDVLLEEIVRILK